MRICYIHIGTHKTGTTAVQKMLRDSEDAIRHLGFEYPLVGRGHESNGHHQLAFAIRNDPKSQANADIIDAFIADVGTFDRSVIVSSEEFVNALYFAPDRFRVFVRSLREHVDRVVLILYLRSQEPYIISNYLERLKYKFTTTFEDYTLAHMALISDEIPLDYLDVLSLAHEISGGHLIARSYDAVRSKGLLAEFQALLGAEDLTLNQDLRVNVRQPLAELINLYYENRTGQVTSAFERQIIMEIISIMTDESVTVSSSLSSLIRKRFDLSNRYILDHYGVSLQVDDGKIPEQVGTPIDQIFTDRLPSLIQTLSRFPERLGSTDVALAEAQRLAINRYKEISDLETRLNNVHAALEEAQHLARERFETMDVALAEAQHLAINRYKEISDLETRLDNVHAALEEAQQLARERFETIASLERQIQISGIDKI